MVINKIEIWEPPTGSYGFSAWETHRGEIFTLRTGDDVSVLNLVDGDLELKLKGKVEVDDDCDCWDIINKFNMIGAVVASLIAAAKKRGKEEVKRELRD